MLHGLVDVAAAGIKDFKYIVVGVGVVNVMIDLTKQITEDDGEFTPGDAIHLVVNMIEVAIPEVGLADLILSLGFGEENSLGDIIEHFADSSYFGVFVPTPR